MSRAPAQFVFKAVTTKGLAAARANVEWVWQGYVARGSLTLLTSQWKSGKTTLLSVLLAKLAAGGKLAGLEVARTTAAVVSEESLEAWRRRHDLLGFGDNLAFFCRPFAARPTFEAWAALVEHLAQLYERQGVGLVVIDPLAMFLPGPAENNASVLLDALGPLARLTAAGQAVLLLHHPRKGETAPGQAARGSGALCASVDVLMEMRLPPATQPQDRRRKLLAWSRYGETPRQRVIELLPDGKDYQVSQMEEGEDAGQEYVELACHLLTCPPRQLTRMQLLSEWPRGVRQPHPVQLWRALDGAVRSGRMAREGSGRKDDPYRYFVAGLGASWIASPGDLLKL